MTTWVLVMVLYGAGLTGAVGTVPNFIQREECERAGLEIKKKMRSVDYICIEQSKVLIKEGTI